MTRARGRRRFAASTVALALVAAGCGGDSRSASQPSPSAAATAPHTVRFCAGHGPGWRALHAEAGDDPVDAAALGDGPPVVLLNQSDNDACAWMAEARHLETRGFRVAVFRYGDSVKESTAVREALAVAAAAGGGRKAYLLGASIGGRIVFEAAARAPNGLAAIVSLSGERRVQGLPDIRPAVAQVTLPVLYVGSREDPYTDGARQPRALKAALGSHDARFIIVDGAEHGIALLDGAARNDIRRHIDAFLAGHS